MQHVILTMDKGASLQMMFPSLRGRGDIQYHGEEPSFFNQMSWTQIPALPLSKCDFNQKIFNLLYALVRFVLIGVHNS